MSHLRIFTQRYGGRYFQHLARQTGNNTRYCATLKAFFPGSQVVNKIITRGDLGHCVRIVCTAVQNKVRARHYQTHRFAAIGIQGKHAHGKMVGLAVFSTRDLSTYIMVAVPTL